MAISDFSSEKRKLGSQLPCNRESDRSNTYIFGISIESCTNHEFLGTVRRLLVVCEDQRMAQYIRLGKPLHPLSRDVFVGRTSFIHIRVAHNTSYICM